MAFQDAAASDGQSIPPLPHDILLQIFSYFLPKDHEEDKPICRYYFDNDREGRWVLFNTRLACRVFDGLVTPLLYRRLTVSLSASSLDRFRNLTKNPRIRDSVRGVDINLRFHSRLVATDITSFHRHQAAPLMASAEQECLWWVEFVDYTDYPDEDLSENAVQCRAFNFAYPRLRAITYNWKKYLKRLTRLEARKAAQARSEAISSDADIDGNADDDDEDDGSRPWLESDCEGGYDGDKDYDKHVRILLDGFSSYATHHAEEAAMIRDQSLARSIAGALLGRTLPISIWFNDGQPSPPGKEYNALKIVADPDLISAGISDIPQQWAQLEDPQGSEVEGDMLMPACLLTDIPIIFHEAGLKIRTLHVHCFPLTVSFASLIPTHARAGGNKQIGDPWTRFVVACHELTSFSFDAYHRARHRPQLLSQSDAAIMDGYLAAAISSPHLENLNLSLLPYRLEDGDRGPGGEKGAPKHQKYYPAELILRGLVSRELRHLDVKYIEVNAATLRSALRSLHPAQLQSLKVSNVILTQGRWFDLMNDLHDTLASWPENGTKPQVAFSSLAGMEFGALWTFKVEDKDRGRPSWQRRSYENDLKKRERPELLRDVEMWVVMDRGQESNPLAVFW